jgi:IclR family transcriptional regulator, acetate operon repressor
LKPTSQRKPALSAMPERESDAVGSLSRGLVILRALVQASQPLSITELAVATGLDQSTIFRLLKVLEDNGCVFRLDPTKRYVASPQTLLPLPLLHPINQLRRDASPIIRDLAISLGETVGLVLFTGMQRMVVEITQSPGSLMPYYNTWLEGPLHGTATGKGLLLGLKSERRKEFLRSAPLEPLTPLTITDPGVLERELEDSAERGFVAAIDQHHIGLSAFASTIATWHGKIVGCLVVTGHTRKFDEARVERVTLELKQMTKLLTYQTSTLDAVASAIGAQ